MRSLNTN